MIEKLRRLSPAALVVGALVLAAGCGGGSSSGSSGGGGTGASGSHMGGTLKLQATGNPDSIDTAIAYQVESWDNLIMTNDGLTGFKKVGGPDGGTLVPDLATELPTPTDGGKTYTFTIRPGIKYSTGATVKPSDFKRAWERDFLVSSPGTWTLGSIEGADKCSNKACDLSSGVQADDANMTLTVHLSAPDPEFLDKVALPFSYAVPNGVSMDKDTGTTPLPATGPYMIQSYTPGQSIKLVRNPNFKEWSKDAQPNGYADNIDWQLGLQADAQVTNIENGTADWMFEQPPPDRLNEIGTKYADQVHINPLTATYWFFMNTNTPPFDNKDVRQAVNFAVDRNALVKLYGGPQLATPTCQVLPPNFPGYQAYCPYTANASADSTKWTGPDMAKAQQLIDASGTKGQNVTVWAETTTLSKSFGEYFVSLLNQLGYKASLKTLDRGVYFDTVDDSKNKAQIGWWDWYQDYPAASDFLNTLLSCDAFIPNSTSNNNASQYCNKAADAKMQEAFTKGQTDQNAANQIWAEVDHMITDDAPWVPVLNPQNIDFLSTRVTNYQFSPQWLMLIQQLQVQ